MDIKARNCPIGSHIQLRDQGSAIFEVLAKTRTDPLDNVEVELVDDPKKEAHFIVGDCSGNESVILLS